jgi:multidrug efflux pump subunit AcrA (membrane-fusion protein)
VLVREGQAVEAGKVVIRLDDAVTRASYQTTRQRFSDCARSSRWPPNNSAFRRSSFMTCWLRPRPVDRQHITAQNQLLRSRRTSGASLGAIGNRFRGNGR